MIKRYAVVDKDFLDYLTYIKVLIAHRLIIYQSLDVNSWVLLVDTKVIH